MQIEIGYSGRRRSLRPSSDEGQILLTARHSITEAQKSNQRTGLDAREDLACDHQVTIWTNDCGAC